MIHVTGDYHGGLDFHRDYGKIVPTEEDTIIFAGDFGILWADIHQIQKGGKYYWKEHKAKKRLLRDFPQTILFIDGNHENFNRLELLPTVEKYGNPVGKYHDRIYHLRRGYVYEIEGKKIFTFGGGVSVDKKYRKEGVSWWPQEIPSYAEIDRGLEELNAVNNEVDYVVTHEAPSTALIKMHIKLLPDKEFSCVKKMMDQFHSIITFKRWYFGHYHDICRIGKYSMLYDNVEIMG